jgi:hypothetical protein
MHNGHVESFYGRLRDECLNSTWFRALNDVRCTLATWREEYNCERPHSSLDYRTPQEVTQQFGYADVESKERFPHPHSRRGGEIVSTPKHNRETPVIHGWQKGDRLSIPDEWCTYLRWVGSGWPVRTPASRRFVGIRPVCSTKRKVSEKI